MTQEVEKALAELQKHPDTPVRTTFGEMKIEIRVLPRHSLADVFREIGHIDDESAEEMLRAVRESRAAGGSRETPSF